MFRYFLVDRQLRVHEVSKEAWCAAECAAGSKFSTGWYVRGPDYERVEYVRGWIEWANDWTEVAKEIGKE